MFRYIVPYRWRLGGIVAVSLVSTALSLTIPYLTKILVDDALIGRDPSALRLTVILFLAAGLISFALSVVSGLAYTRVSAEILFDMRRDLYAHLQRLSPRFYAATRLGDIVSRINNDVAEIQRIAAEIALAWFGNVLFLVGSLAILIWLDWRLTVVAAAALPPAIWALVIYRRLIERRTETLRERSADIGSFLIETLQGMRTVVTAAAEPRELRRFGRLNDAFIATLMGVQRTHYIAGGIPALVIGAGTAAVFFYGGSRVVQGTLTLGTLAAFLAYQARVVAPIQALLGLYGSLATARVSWRRVKTVFDTPPDVAEAPDAIWPDHVRGDVSFDDVSLSHGRGPILDRMSFRVGAGETLAIVGPSGSGKSTIADLAVRLIDPDSGVVSLDGIDLRRLRLADLRRAVYAVEQEPTLFHGSIDENVRYARPDATDAEIDAAVAAAGLAEFVRRLPDGRRTLVGTRGFMLSAGERQRVALARAFLANPVVLILDEPSAALDADAERAVLDGFQRVMRGRTTIVITHRPELARACDRVLTLEHLRSGPIEKRVNGG